MSGAFLRAVADLDAIARADNADDASAGGLRAGLLACADQLDKLNTPEIKDFAKGVVSEAQHQRARWGAEHDAGKAPLDWVWLLGHLINKAALAAIAGDADKAKHHTISSAAALANWHAQLAGHDNTMRPGIDAVARGIEHHV